MPRPTAREWLQFAILREAPRMPNGRFVGMVTAPVEPWPHQAIVARRLIASFPYSFLLCDEVGLGKTIEAGLALRAPDPVRTGATGFDRAAREPGPAVAERAGDQVLPALRPGPLRRSTAASTTCIRMSEQIPAKSVFAPDLVIVSTGLVRRKDRQRELAALGSPGTSPWSTRPTTPGAATRPPDCGATQVRGPLPGGQPRPREPRTRCLWLATATPMQLDPIEVYDLFRLTRRVGPFQDDPSLTQAYYEMSRAASSGASGSPTRTWASCAGCCGSLARHDPELADFVRQTVLESARTGPSMTTG